MKRTFKIIVVSIISTLSIIFVIQLGWLYNFYKTIEAETNQTILSALEDADMEEIIMRLEAHEKKKESKNGTDKSEVSLSFNMSNDEPIESDDEEYIERDDNKHEDLHEMLNALVALKQGMLVAMHQAIDTIIAPDLPVLDSILMQGLHNKGINVKLASIEYRKLGSDSVLSSSSSNPEILLSERDNLVCFPYSIMLSDKLTMKAKEDKISLEYEDNYEYRFYFEPLFTAILRQMGGILITTFLILLILIFAFWYLLRTVLAMKTLEELKDDFTNNMTHELKTPIAVAYSATDVLLNYNKDNNPIKTEKYLNICKDQLERLTQLVESILSLNMERRKSLVMNKSLFELKPVIESIVEQHKLKYKKLITVAIDIQPNDLLVLADKAHFTNVLSNLVDNAVKYSEESCNINIFAGKTKNDILINIKDNGMGIPSDKIGQIFDKFYRVPSGNIHNRKGYGLGLFYVKTIIDKHNGKIYVSSKLNKGTEFSIIIPIDE